MVAGAIVGIGAVILFFVVFKDDLANFLSGGLTGAGAAVTESIEDVGGSIFQAGAGAGKAFAEQQAVERAERDIELAAKEQGFATVEDANRATDSGSVVIGGQRTTVDFGLIGNVIPTNPSREFVQSEEGQRLIKTNPAFAEIVKAQATQEATTPEQVKTAGVFKAVTRPFVNIDEMPFAFARFGGRRKR